MTPQTRQLFDIKERYAKEKAKYDERVKELQEREADLAKRDLDFQAKIVRFQMFTKEVRGAISYQSYVLMIYEMVFFYLHWCNHKPRMNLSKRSWQGGKRIEVMEMVFSTTCSVVILHFCC